MSFGVSAIWVSPNGLGQNLVNNGDFEDFECPDNEINSLSATDTWYPINSDAYLLDLECPLDPDLVANVPAINLSLLPFDGISYISLEALLSGNGYFISEGMGIELNESLEAGHFYYFDMAFTNYELSEGAGHPGISCDPIPERFMEIRFSEEPISITVNYENVGTLRLISGLNINSTIKLINESATDEDFRNNQWHTFWDCFEADGSELHLAITGNNFHSTQPVNCIDSLSDNILYNFGYAIDAINLVRLPDPLDTMLYTCPGGFFMNLQNFVEGPFFDKASFEWSDGFIGSERPILTEGEYRINMNLPCVTIPLTFRVEEVLCLATIYVANAFSPNNDGINDRLIPSIKALFNISGYEFFIYDSWGQEVFKTTVVGDGWNGEVAGQESNSGVYTWIMKYVLDDGTGIQHARSGTTLAIK